MACAKGSAVGYLQTAPGCQALSVFFTWQQVSLSQVKERSVPNGRQERRSFAGFATCFFIYDFFFLLIWEILTGLFHAARSVRAAGGCRNRSSFYSRCSLGYLHAKNIKSVSYSWTLVWEIRTIISSLSAISTWGLL